MTALLEHPPAAPQNSAVQRGPRALRKFRPDIEGLRAVAVTIVVFSHLGLGLPGGYIGVDVFFVISGFLITRQLVNEYEATRKISFRGFYARRAKRILPAATVVIVGTVLACKHWDSPLNVRNDALDGLFSAFSGVNWRLAAQGTNYFSLGSAPSPFQHYWSLSVEEQFYIFWPLLIVGVSWFFGKRFGRRASLIWTLLLLGAVSLGLSVATTRNSVSWAYFGTQTRVWELAFGALIAVTVSVWTRMPPAFASQMTWLGLIIIGICCVKFNAGTIYPGAAAIWPVLGSGFVIAGGCPGWPRSAEWLLRRRSFQFVGGISFSWYLTHWPVLTVLPMALGRSLTVVDKWAVLVGSFALAVAMYFVVEQPIRSRKFLVARPSIGLLLGFGFIATSVVIALTVANSVPQLGGSATAKPLVAATSTTTVTKAVTAAVKVSKLPANVTPALTAAAKDNPTTSTKCLQNDPGTGSLPPDGSCVIGDAKATRSIVLTGDSHADQWTPALDAFGKADHWKIVVYDKAACSPGIYPTYVDPITNRIYVQCSAFRTAVAAKIRSLKPTYVILGSEVRTVDIDPGGMVQSIKNFEAAGSKVIFLEDTPSPDKIGLIPNCLASHLKDIKKCSTDRSAYSTRLEGMIQRTNEVKAVRATGASLIDPTEWFCTSALCPGVINNIIVYRDNSHITATYAKWLSPVVVAALRKITTG